LSSHFYSYEEPNAAEHRTELFRIIGMLDEHVRERKAELALLEEQRMKLDEDHQFVELRSWQSSLEAAQTSTSNAENIRESIIKAFAVALSGMSRSDIRRVCMDACIVPYTTPSQKPEYLNVQLFFLEVGKFEASVPLPAIGLQEYLRSLGGSCR
jgi:hypothetical protein